RGGAHEPRLELGVALHGQEVGVAVQLYGLHQPLAAALHARRHAGDDEPAVLQALDVVGVHLVAVAVALVHRAALPAGEPVDPFAERAGEDLHGPRAQAQRAAQALHLQLLGDEADDRVRRVRVELGGVRALQARHVAGELDDGHLHAQADAQVGDAALAGDARRLDLALYAPHAEAARHEDAGVALQRGRVVGHEALGVHPLHVHGRAVRDARVLQRLEEAQVGVGHGHVLAHDRDVHGALGPLEDPHGLLPHAQLGGHRLEVQLALDEAAHALLLEHLGHGVDVVGVVRVEDRVGLDVREQGDLLELLQRHLGLRAQDQGVGLYAHAPQRGHRVLRWLRLELLARAQERHQRDVEVERVLAPGVEAELPYGLQERQRLDVAHRAAHLDQHHLGVGGLAGGADALLDLVGDVRDDLDGVREVGAAALLLDDAQVDLTGGDVVAARQVDVQEALVGADVQVGLGAVVGDEHLAVLVGTHRPGVHVDVGVDLHGRD